MIVGFDVGLELQFVTSWRKDVCGEGLEPKSAHDEHCGSDWFRDFPETIAHHAAAAVHVRIGLAEQT